MLGNVSLLNATVLTSTRMPSSMARGWLPAALFAASIRNTARRGSRSAFVGIYALLAFHTLAQL